MYFKLALSNVKKSIKDYAIYFLTLTLSVCIFYVFNGIESQKAMMMLSETTDMMIQNLVSLIGYLSIFIAIVLGFLILYANKFLIKRRKKELGLYMLLGMDKWKISLVLVIETLVIGLCSLVIGLFLGIFLSQALSVFTAKLFGAQMTQFQFVFSKNGFYKSILCFVIIYVTVMVFNVMTLSKCKLIDLIYAYKKNESPKVRHLGGSVILFILSVICLVLAYVFIIKNSLMVIDIYFFSAFILAFIGTFLFFMSLSGFLLKVIQWQGKLYYNELNMFIFRQINSKINTTYISMTFICLMLAVTIVCLSSGMAMNQSMRDELIRLTPYDASFVWEKHYREIQAQYVDVEEELRKFELNMSDYAKEYGVFEIYESPITYGMIYEGQNLTNQPVYTNDLQTRKLGVMALSEYNSLLQLQGGTPIELAENEYAINCQRSDLQIIADAYLKQHDFLEYGDKKLKDKYNKSLGNTLYVQVFNSAKIVLIVPDELLEKDLLMASILNLNYHSPDMEQKLLNDVASKEAYFTEEENGVEINGITKSLVYDTSVGMSAIMTYLTVYIAIIFLLTSAAILALQQLTEAEDNRLRYQLLAKLGVDQSMVERALFIQIAIYFGMPLILAIIHGIVGIYVANQVIIMFGEINILSSIILTAIMFIMVYGTYFVGTYFGGKNLLK